MEPLVRSVQTDNQLYFFVAERVASGVPPHISLVDHKHQLPALLSGAAIAAGRRLGADDVIAARVLSIAVAVVIVVGLFALAHTLTGDPFAAMLTALAFLSFRTVFLEAATGFRPQLFMMGFAVLGHLAFARGRPFAAGALAACAFLCWQPAGLVGLAMFVAAIAGRKRSLTTVASLMAGAIAANLAYEAYYLLHGVIGEQLRQSYLMASSSAGFHPEPITETLDFLTREIGRGRSLQDYLSLLMLLALTALPMVAVIAPERAAAAWASNAGWRAITLAAAAAVAFTFVDHQAYPDRFFYLPYVALTAAIPAAVLSRYVANRGARAVALTAVGVLFAVLAFRPENKTMNETLQRQRAFATGPFVALVRKYEGSVWVVGRPDLLAFNYLDNWTSFGMLLDPRVRVYAVERNGGLSYRPLRGGRMPQVILSARGSMRRYAPWLTAEYEPMPNADIWKKQHIAASIRLDEGEILRRATEKSCGLRPGTPRGEHRRTTASDALWLLQAALGAIDCTPCACDADGSGQVTASDALRLLKRATNPKVPLLCPPCRGTSEATQREVSRRPRSTSSKRRSTGKPHG
jgi:hypothetical protein